MNFATACGVYSEVAVDPRSSRAFVHEQATEHGISSVLVVAIVAPVIVVVTLLALVSFIYLYHTWKAKQLKALYVDFTFPLQDEWHIDRSRVQLKELIGKGAFGKVYQCLAVLGDGPLKSV